jgi:hypothetical protein
MDELLPGIDLEMLFEIGAGFRKVRVENFQEIEREFAGVHVGLEIDSVCGRHGVDGGCETDGQGAEGRYDQGKHHFEQGRDAQFQHHGA